MKFFDGAWVIDKTHGMTGYVLRVFPDGVTARFGEMTAIRKNENVELAPLDLCTEDFKDMMELALMTKDFDWAHELHRQMTKEEKAVW